MKKLLLPILILLSLFTFNSSLIYGQESFTVNLSRKVYPALGFNVHGRKFFTSPMTIPTKNGKDSTFTQMDNYNLVAGDFADGKTKFTLALNLKQDYGKQYTLYINPYKSDSVFTDEVVNSVKLEPDKIVSLEAYAKEFGAMVNRDLNSITLFRLDGEYHNPDARIYDSILPDRKFTLLNGDKDSFSRYKHQNKYIFIMFWNTWQPGNTKDIDELKNISDLYKEALTVISIHRDTLVVKQLQKEKGLDWIEGKDSHELADIFPASGASEGVLFDTNGKAIRFGLWPDELKPLIERLLHVTR